MPDGRPPREERGSGRVMRTGVFRDATRAARLIHVKPAGGLGPAPIAVGAGQDQTRAMFVGVAPSSSGAERLFAADLAQRGYVMNASRVWAYAPDAHDGLFDLMKQST